MGQPSFPTIKRLFAVSGNICAFPECRTPLVDETSGKVTGRICHINAQSEGGPRYDATQSEEEQHGFENLILMCPVHHDIIDADHRTYTVERLQQMKFDHESSHPLGAKGIDLPDNIARMLLASAAPANLSDGSIVTSVNQSGGQIAHSITNVDRQVLLNKHYANERLTLDIFAIDRSRCAYQEHRFDATRPFWPEKANPTAVCYYGQSDKIGRYGKVFDSWEKAEEYGDMLRQKHNHYSFYEGAPHTMFLERLEKAPKGNRPNYPVFYVSTSNHTNAHIVLSEIAATVHRVTPLTAVGESHMLLPLRCYAVKLAPTEGVYRTPAVPSLKIESGDAAAFHLLLEPSTGRMGGYSWLITLRFGFGRHSIRSDTFALVM
ncbi:MAG: hypothetical protein ABSH49_01915 [Bryobacteraceae bacterium]